MHFFALLRRFHLGVSLRKRIVVKEASAQVIAPAFGFRDAHLTENTQIRVHVPRRSEGSIRDANEAAFAITEIALENCPNSVVGLIGIPNLLIDVRHVHPPTPTDSPPTDPMSIHGPSRNVVTAVPWTICDVRSSHRGEPFDGCIETEKPMRVPRGACVAVDALRVERRKPKYVVDHHIRGCWISEKDREVKRRLERHALEGTP